MREEQLKHLHELNLMLADELKRICDKYEIKYFMIAGTLLGAVRHKGFIPWDDDMDFGMLRPDFEKFLEVCKVELDSESFFLQTDRNDKTYPFNFAKIRLKGTRIVEEGNCSVNNTNQGIFIDIFPFDIPNNNSFLRSIQYNKYRIYKSMLLKKSGYGTPKEKNTWKYKTIERISRHFSYKKLKDKKTDIITKYSKKNGIYVVAGDGSYGTKKETLKREWIDSLKNYSFEDRVFPGISDSDAYLSYFYGDYMKVPPEDKRNKHGVLDLDFGKY